MNQNEKIPCDICEYFSSPMTENYFDHFSKIETTHVCLDCASEAMDESWLSTDQVKIVLETLVNAFIEKELENLNGLAQGDIDDEVLKACMQSYYSEETCPDPQ